MSEMRKRRGDAEEEEEVTEVVNEVEVKEPIKIQYVTSKYEDLFMTGGACFKKTELTDILRMSALPSTQLENKLSMTNATKAVKDELEKDPYNIELIHNLGVQYIKEFQYDLAANVMMRGWKRASELKTASERFAFLSKLCEASLRNKQFKQAHAILMDIQEPEAGYERNAFFLLSCKVYSENNDSAKTLQAFTKVIEGCDFEDAHKFWAACALALRKAGTFEASKNTMTSKVRSGKHHYMDQERIKTVESWSVMSILPEDKEEENILQLCLEGKPPKKVIRGVQAFLVLLVIYMLYCAEQNSLKRLNLIK
jgi:hypothetical protein